MINLVCFDLDGTLMPGTSTSLFLAEKLGHLKEAQELERRYRHNEITNIEIADATARFFRGVPLATIDQYYRAAPKIRNIATVVNGIRDRQVTVILASITWSFFVEMFASEFGFDSFCGTKMEIDRGVLTGKVHSYFTEFDKLEFFLKACEEKGIATEDALAVGDSRSDHPVFQAAGVSVALNADDQTRTLATHTLDTNDLVDLLPLLQ